jgi:hypothetical protein
LCTPKDEEAQADKEREVTQGKGDHQPTDSDEQRIGQLPESQAEQEVSVKMA